MPDIKPSMIKKRGFNMAEYLKEFIDGEDILAAETNANNNYLLDQIRDSSSVLNTKVNTLTSNVNSEMATLRSDINSKITEANKNIESLINTDYTQKTAPDYSKTTVINLGSGSAVGFNGWMSVRAYTNPNDQYFFVYINGTPVFTIRGGSNGGYPDDSTGKFMVSTNDIITYEGNAAHTFYRIPFKGGN